MALLEPCSVLSKKVLIITSSGGGGLLQAAQAKEQEIRLQSPEILVVRRDLLKDWFGKKLGTYFANRWNHAQLKGDVAAQAFCIWAQSVADWIFWPYLFCCALYTLFKEDADRLIDTQPMGTSAILQALQIFNRRKKKQIFLEKVLVDLPTKKATHFFQPIKALSAQKKKLLKLITIAPMLEEGQTAEQFWQENCRLSEKEICYEDVYVRQAFRHYQKKEKAKESIELKIRFQSLEEMAAMRKSFERGKIQVKILEKEVHFQIAPQDRVIAILLGSQPANVATLNYVKGFIELAKEEKKDKRAIHLFVFCADYEKGKNCLFEKVVDLVSKAKGFPKHLSVVPFSFQKDDAIAPLFYRSDITCTRSGGQTAMELMCVSRGEIWIHSEAKKEKGQREPLKQDQLLAGIPGWESASAVYLERFYQAKIVTPETFLPFARDRFDKDAARDRSSHLLERPLQSTA